MRTFAKLAAVAGAVATAAPAIPAQTNAGVIPGIEVLLSDSMHLIRGKRVGLLTNQSGRDRQGRNTIDLLFNAPGVELTALFGPEHGLRGIAKAGEKVGSSVDSATGVPVYSLFGDVQVPTPKMLENVDVLVYDIQDVGARVYTYEWTLAMTANAIKKPIIVLDRPDPIRADRYEGNILDPRFASLVGKYPVALRYGLTPGELMRFLAGTKLIDADVHVVPMKNYRRAMWFDETKIPWVNPSPNLRSLDAELLYPGTVFFEGTTATEGRGTEAPFTLIGAAWMTDNSAIAKELNALQLPGVRFDTATRTIEPGYKFGGQTIPMIKVSVVDRDRVRAVDVGVRMLRAISAHHPKDFQWRTPQIDRLAGTDALRAAVERNDVDALLGRWDADAAEFARRVKPYLIYQTSDAQTSDTLVSRELAPGVAYRKFIDPRGPLVMYLVRVDLRRPDLEVTAARADDRLRGREKTTSMVERAARAGGRVLAAVNADFFDLKTGENENEQVIAGEWLKGLKLTDSPYDTYDNAHTQLALDSARHPFMDRFILDGRAWVKGGRATTPVITVNHDPSGKPEGTALFTSRYGAATPRDTTRQTAEAPLVSAGRRGDTLLFVRRGAVSSQSGTPIPADGAVLSAYGAGLRTQEVRAMRDGDTVDVLLEPLPRLSRGARPALVIGGWPRILRDGVDVTGEAATVEGTLSGNAEMKHPRTAVGFSRDSATLFILAVDGRSQRSVGVTLAELADVMRRVGAWQAMNFDGGGSTTMVIDGAVVNAPSDTAGERAVGSALMVVKKR